jgi:hypothetical protein
MDSYIKKEDALSYLTKYIPRVEAVTLDEITDLYQNMDADFIERYYPEYTRLTGSWFVIGEQIAQGNLLRLLELWKQYRRFNNV